MYSFLHSCKAMNQTAPEERNSGAEIVEQQAKLPPALPASHCVPFQHLAVLFPAKLLLTHLEITRR